MTEITRVGYCENCAKEHRPKTGQRFLVQGSSHRDYQVMKAARNGRAGFVPFIYSLNGYSGNKIYYQRICTMEGCGCYKHTLADGKCVLRTYEDAWSPVMIMSVKDWDALVLFKDTGFEI